MTEVPCPYGAATTTPHFIIEPHFERPQSSQERVFQRRRLSLLVGLFLAVLVLAPMVARAGSDAQTVDAGGVVAAEASEPVTLSGVIAETTSTLIDTPTTVPPSTTTTTEPSADSPRLHETAYTTTTTSAPPSTTAPTTTAGPSTTAAPSTTAPPTTAAPTTTSAPPTTAAPSTTESSDKGYAYDDPRSTQVWYDLADCEAGGNWSINTGNGYYGGLQFSLSSWESVGGSGYPHRHPAGTQIKMGRRLQARQGWGAWPHCSRELGLR